MSETTTDLRGEIYALIAEFSGSNRILAIPQFYIEMIGDLQTAAMLSQIIYACERAEDGWAELPHEYWATTLAISPHTVRKCTAALKPYGVITKRMPKADGGNPLCYHVDRAALTAKVLARLNLRRSKTFTFESENLSLSIKELKELKERDIAAHSKVKVQAKTELDAWYDAVKAVWGFEAALNVNYGKWLRGETVTGASGKAFMPYRLAVPLQSPADLLAWADWYKEVKQHHEDLDMLAQQVKVQSSIAEWQATLKAQTQVEQVKRDTPPPPKPAVAPFPIFANGKLVRMEEDNV